MQTTETLRRLKTVETTTCARTSPVVISVPEAAAIIGGSKEYLYRGMREGRFPCVKTGRRRNLPASFVDGFVTEVIDAGLSISCEDYAGRWRPRRTTAAM